MGHRDKWFGLKSVHASGSSVQTSGTKSSSARSRNNSAGTISSSSAPRSQTPLDLDRGLTESPAELRVARKVEVTSAHTVTIYPELDRYRDVDISPATSDGYGPAHPDILFRLATEGFPPPPTPYYSGTNSLTSGMSGSPSTRFSESPGPGPYSRDTTPTSMSSHSPGLISSVRMPSAPRLRQPVRGRTGSFGKDSANGSVTSASIAPTQTLAAIRESLNSSSSSSNGTVRGGDKREKIKKKRMSPVPPSPPPRKSSQNFKKSDDEKERDSPMKQRQRPLRTHTQTSQPTQSARPSQPPASQKSATKSEVPGSSATATSSQRHRTVASPPQTTRQQPTPPARPSRDGTPDLSQLDFTLPVIQSNLAYAPSPDHLEDLHQSASSPPSASAASAPVLEQARFLYDQQHQRRPGSPSHSQQLVRPQDTNIRSPTSRHPAGTTQSQTTESSRPARTVSSSPGPTLSSRADSRQGRVPTQVQVQTQVPGNSSKESVVRPTRTPSPNVSTFRTRLNLFGRRTKTAPPTANSSASALEKKESGTTRKGPTAGTGHEGYGRLGSGRRRSSSVSTFLRGTGSSQESLASSSPQFQDPFLRDRLSPVVIAGGEIVDNQNKNTTGNTTGYELSQTTSNTSASLSVSASGVGGARTNPPAPSSGYYRRPSTDSRADSVSSREDRLSLWPSAIPRGSRQVSPSPVGFGYSNNNNNNNNNNTNRRQGSRRPSDSSDSEAVMKPTLAFRRSVQRLRSPDRAQVRVPRPIVVTQQNGGIPSSMTSADMSIMSDDSVIETRPDTAVSASASRGRKGSVSNNEKPPAMPKKLTKRARSPRKWNLFGRSQSQPATSKKALQSTSTVAVTVEAAAVPVEKKKPVAFYAMIDSSEQEDGDMDVEDILREARIMGSPKMPERFGSRERRPSIEQTVFGSDAPPGLPPGFQPTRARAPPPPSPALSQMSQQQQYQPEPAPSMQEQQQTQQQEEQQRVQREQFHQQQQQQQMRLQLSRSAAGPVVREVPIETPAPSHGANSNAIVPPPPTAARQGRPSRLPQVGRIPKVVSARPEQTSPKSFSRPFNRVSMQLPSSSLGPLLNSLDTASVAKGPSPPKSITPDLMHDGSTVTGSSADPTARRFRLSQNVSADAELIDQGNEFFSLYSRKDSQTTSCTSSSGLFSFADATAVVPDPTAPLVEDEIWDEYNDLLGEDGSKIPQSATSSQGMPFHLEVPPVKEVRTSPSTLVGTAKRLDQRTVAPLESPTIVVNLRPKRSISSAAAAKTGRPPVASSIYSVNSPTRLVDHAADDQRDSQLSQPPPTPFSVTDFVSGYGDRNNSGIATKKLPAVVASQRSSASSQRSAKRRTRVSDSSVYSQVSEDNSPMSQVNLRVGSMTVSKWLTFGHVLFSPARDDMVKAVNPPNGHSVLVIDGLGNDDWSFYAAETYPAATFFNLSPRAPLPVDQKNGASAFPISPLNHHQIQYKSHADKLPFGPELFTTVVLRFPAAAPESHYKNIVNEARRVLKPGGYLELSILDVDLNNMGPRTRRAIRRLKEQAHSHTPDIHMGSAADAILRLLGIRGFTDIKSCRVGIPVASAIPQPNSDMVAADDVKRATTGATKPKKDQRSLAEMINDESPVADENITSMVARVGRWWHSRCYGDAAFEPSQRSAPNTTGSSDMWMDRALLAECEGWGTNLKLMVCYARVPDLKRVASI
ncbi:hypothetical protein Sste5346_002517 [Sporothrix stenoceras]|uniref:Methyltransferase type 11 n=1 Tax=Sporothrix stenoceras TaxID=5173 RepID=A0ABR3ZJ20_9PEZI